MKEDPCLISGNDTSPDELRWMWVQARALGREGEYVSEKRDVSTLRVSFGLSGELVIYPRWTGIAR